MHQRDGILEQLIGRGFSDVIGRLTVAPADAAEPVAQPIAARTDGPADETLWDRIFGRKSPDVPAAAGDGSHAQQRWGM